MEVREDTSSKKESTHRPNVYTKLREEIPKNATTTVPATIHVKGRRKKSTKISFTLFEYWDVGYTIEFCREVLNV